MFKNYKFRNYDLKLVVLVLALSIIGIFVIGSANEDYQNKQILGLVLGLVVMTIVSFIDYDFILQFTKLYYIGIVGLLALVLVLGDHSKGATRWIDVGIRFQPSELAKILLVLFFANYLMQYEDEINVPRRLLSIAVLAGIPLVLILKEPDLSTTIVTFMIVASMMFITGLSYKIVGGVLAVVIPLVLIIIGVLLKDGETILNGYQGLRILAWLKPDKYPESAYQQQNSIMAIGSGRLFGKGLNNTSVDSVKNGNYISEPQTDCIFAVAGEELGFIGCIVIIGLLFLIVIECIMIAKRAKDLSGCLICTGIGALIGFQSFFNICVVTGLMPNTGLPLPFVSYGLTSLVTIYIGIGLVLNVALQSKNTKGGRP